MRKDAWTGSEDIKLVEIIFHHMKEGSTQLEAFEEASEVFGRTSAACGFRWNAVLRPMHEEQFQMVKKERRAKVKRSKKREVSLFVLERLKGSKSAAQAITALTEYTEELLAQLESSKQENLVLKQKLERFVSLEGRTNTYLHN